MAYLADQNLSVKILMVPLSTRISAKKKTFLQQTRSIYSVWGVTLQLRLISFHLKLYVNPIKDIWSQILIIYLPNKQKSHLEILVFYHGSHSGDQKIEVEQMDRS